MSHSEAKQDLYAGTFFSLLSLLFLFVLNKHGIDIPTTNYQSGSSAVLPDFFPNMICWSTFVFSSGLAFTSWKSMRAGASAQAIRPGTAEMAAAVKEEAGTLNAAKREEKAPEDNSSKAIVLAFRLAGMGTLLLLYYVVDFLGIVIAGFLFYLLYALFTGERRPARAVVGAAAATLILYYFFVKVAAVPLPLGLLSDIL